MGTNNKVMLVEDDSTMLSVLTTLLEIEGYQVITSAGANGLDDIIQTIQNARPNILLLDVHIRDVNGYDVIQRIRNDAQIAHTRVIMSSGMDLKDQCLAAGANDFLLKPYMPDELLGLLNK